VAPFQNFVSGLPIASSGIMGEQTALQKVSSMILWSCFCWSYSKAASQVLFREIAIPDCTVSSSRNTFIQDGAILKNILVLIAIFFNQYCDLICDYFKLSLPSVSHLIKPITC